MKDEYDFRGGRRGAVIKGADKTRVTIYLDNEVLDAFRARAEQSGRGYQTLINEALRSAVAPESAPVTVAALRRVLHEEFGRRQTT